MPTSITVVAADPETRARLVGLLPTSDYTTVSCHPSELPSQLPAAFVIALPGVETPEEQVIEHLRADEQSERTPIVIASDLSMVELQSVPYASDWTIAVVEEPVSAEVLKDTLAFLLGG